MPSVNRDIMRIPGLDDVQSAPAPCPGNPTSKSSCNVQTLHVYLSESSDSQQLVSSKCDLNINLN